MSELSYSLSSITKLRYGPITVPCGMAATAFSPPSYLSPKHRKQIQQQQTQEFAVVSPRVAMNLLLELIRRTLEAALVQAKLDKSNATLEGPVIVAIAQRRYKDGGCSSHRWDSC